MTIPGIDMVVAVGLIAAIGPVARFAGPDRLVAYLGLNPSVHQSGSGKPRHGRITKQGRTHARSMLVEAAWQAVRGPGPLRAFFQRVSGRRGPHIAAVAVARKLAVIIWHLLQRGNQDETRVASPEMLPEGGSLPHLICSPPQLGGGGSDEAGEHGNAR